ncbi:MAG TPA: KTSC domain-containing protein [Alphaproteobacteria bacterium]
MDKPYTLLGEFGQLYGTNGGFPRFLDMPSTAVEFAGYNPDARTMFVKFRGDGLYRYFDVPQKEYDAYRAARSKGKFVNENIKPKYAFEKSRD